MLSRTVPTAEGGIPKVEGSVVLGLSMPFEESLLLFFGLITRRPTGIKIAARTTMNAAMTHIIALRLVHIRLLGAASAANGQVRSFFSGSGSDFSGSEIGAGSVGSTKGFA